MVQTSSRRHRPATRAGRWIRAIGATAALGLVAACGAGSGSEPPATIPAAAAAAITSIAPASVVAATAFTLTVNGTGFVPASVVSAGAVPLATTFVSATQLTAAVPATAATSAGTVAIVVATTGSSASNALNLAVTAPVSALALTSLSPAGLGAGSAAFTLTLTGTGFTTSSRVVFNGAFLPTTFVSATQLTAAAPALPSAATIQVAVANGAASSAALTFDVSANPFPAVLSRSFSNPNIFGDRDSTLMASSSTGRFVAFQSIATNLVTGDLGNGTASSIYLRDTCVGAASGCTPSTSLVSVNAAGAQCMAATGLGSLYPAISGDGRFVAFYTDVCFPSVPASSRQIALRDTCVTAAGPIAGCTASTTLVSANTLGQPSAAGLSTLIPPALSRNGRYVAWSSQATDLVAGVATGGFIQLYLRDRCATSSGPVAGCTVQTLLVSRTAAAAANYDASQQFVAVSDNGIVVFNTSANNLVANPLLQPGSGGAVFRADCAGGVSLCALSIVSIVPGSGTSTSGVLLDSQLPSISVDGRFIGFLAQGENSTGSLVPTPPPNLPPPNLQLPGRQAMLFDSCIGAAGSVAGCTPRFSYASVLDNGNLDVTLAAQANLAPSLSDDGRFVSFAAPYNLAPAYQGGTAVYVRDTCGGGSAPSGCMPHTALVSVDALGVQAGTVGWSHLSGDGHFVVFYSAAAGPAGTSRNLPTGQVIMVRSGF